MKYAYQNGGSPLLSWRRAAPQETRAADAKALGSLGGSSLDGPTLELPRAGAPEPVGGVVYESDGGFRHPMKNALGCSGCGGGKVMESMGNSIVDKVAGLSMPVKIAGAVGLFLLYKKLKKKKR